MRFEPIAIIGQSCTLPGALTPDALWANVLAGKSSVSAVPPERWGLPRASAMGTVAQSADRTWSDAGGYVSGFEFDATGFAVPADELRALDPVFHLTLQGARAALRDAQMLGASTRAGLVLGNLSFPSAAMARFAQSVWLGNTPRPHPKNRFNSGLPALVAARALGLEGGAFALDAACASSLYAIKLACDRLHDRTADLMVAGAVNQADDLFIHVGFCALSALSKTGQSRPFHREADGLVPAEGAGFVVLQRLDDALAAGRRVLGVIRGVGLSNDGRGRGLLAPSEEGQERALRQAYEHAGVAPAQIGLLECHATGTPVGDATELKSTARVFAGTTGVPIGSLKSNLGHLITAAGVAGLIKVLAAMKHGTRPPTLHAEAPNAALAGSPFRLLNAAEPWVGPKRAGISAFGFGGNNAHLIVESIDETRPRTSPQPAPRSRVAIVGVGARVGRGESAHDFARDLFTGSGSNEARVSVEVALDGLRFPPNDLQQSLAQQTLVLEAAREAAHGVTLTRDRTSVLIGMGCDAEVARYGARWRLAQAGADPTWLRAARDAIVPVLQAPGVVGTMPNIPANRINSQLDLAGPAFTVSAEEGSGLTALELAARALRAEEIDAALVGAVDLSHEPVHQAALAALGRTTPPADAAVVLTLKRLDDARRDGDSVFAVLEEPTTAEALEVDPAAVALVPFAFASSHGAIPVSRRGTTLRVAFSEPPTQAVLDALKGVVALDIEPMGANEAAIRAALRAHHREALQVNDLTPRLGTAHAAHGLVQVAASALALRHGARLQADGAATPWFGARRAAVSVSVLDGGVAQAQLEGAGIRPWVAESPGRLYVFSGATKREVLSSLATTRESPSGPARLVIVAATAAELQARADSARRWLEGGGPVPEGVAYRDAPIEGQLAFVFTGAAAAYAGMGRELALALPKQVAAVAARCNELKQATDWLYGPGAGKPEHPLDQLWGTTFVCQLHAEITRRVLGLQPEATIGYSSGESNALFAMGAWNDLGAMMRESREGTIFTEELAGRFEAPKRTWKRLGVNGSSWATHVIAAPLEQVRAALALEPLAHLTIINTPEDCVIGGEAQACERVVQRVGRERTMPLGYDLAAHCPEVEELRDAWWALHHRAVTPVREVRFYTNATNGWFNATSQAAADAITGQALRTMDFAKTIEQAWADGVRVFLEHGPRGLCSGWIRRVLGDREHLVVPLDVAGRSGVRQLLNATAWLVAAGVPCQAEALQAELSLGVPPSRTSGAHLTLPAHQRTPHLPPIPPSEPVMEFSTPQVMAPAPALEPILRAPPRTVTPAAPAQPLAKAVAPTPAPPPRAPVMNDTLERLVAQQARLAAIHREFLEQQATVHERFLSSQRAAEASLMNALGNVGRAPPQLVAAAPAVVPPPPPAERVIRKPVVEAPTPRSIAVAPAPEQPKPVAAQPHPTTLPGPKFSRAQLEVLASGRISEIFGPAFAGQDGYARQVRMPEPPLLLADRVTGIDAVPGSMAKGTLWTETDVRADSWYLDDEGRMPAGVMIEAGQADLLLISWLGIDALNKGERVYRLLGCELTYRGGLPVPGDTLAYDIHVDGHATQGDVRLFFFHYDCRVRGATRLSVRNGQAGFFTDEELANSAGVLWDALEEQPPKAQVDAPAVRCTKRTFSFAELEAFAAGRPFECFGAGWETAQPHVRSPRITSKKMQFLREVTEFDPSGGPWKRGYLRAETPVTPDDWFFTGHFKNDPCMPGTLMFEGCLQAMAIYLAGLGFTIERDGWRFEPVPDTAYPMRCRGQVTPTSKHLVYEVFVSEVSAGPLPTVWADLLVTVDGRKAFHAKRVGLRLVPDWPLEHWKHLAPAATQLTGEAVPLRQLAGLKDYVEPKPVATVDGFAFDYHSLLACAWGPPSAAFGPFYSRFDGTRRAARLPGPPYHFMSRVTKLDGALGGMKPGTAVEVEYDVPVEQWYFEQNGNPTMPFCVIMEAALQPCGWLASYVGSALTTDTDMLFRNLDGTGTLLREILPASGVFKTKVKLLSVSQSAGMIIENFDVECFIGETRVFEMKTVFGFFPKEAFENQVGLPVTADERARLFAPPDFTVDLTTRPPKYCGGALRLPGPMLLMLDRVVGYVPDGGPKGLGFLRAEKTVDVDEWFFKAHFFQDPVQPGSLGVEALCQLLQFFMLEKGLGEGLKHPRFEPLMLEKAVTWKYRGQVVPKNKVITTELQITELGEDEHGRFAVAEGWLWVDGKRIYHAKNLGMRIVEGPDAPTVSRPTEDEVLDPATDAWLLDHRPTWTLPALPMMSMVDRLAGAVGQPVRALRDVQVHRWLPFAGGPVRLRTEVDGDAVTLLAWRDATNPALSRFEPVASGRVEVGPPAPAPAPFAPLSDLAAEPDPYASGALFHGPAFQYLESLKLGATGSTAMLRASRGTVPRGALHQGLLDAATHGVPHDGLSRWSWGIPAEVIGYPYRLKQLRSFAPLPDEGVVRVEARFVGFDGDDERFPMVDVQVISGERVLLDFRLVEILLPRGPIGSAPREARRRFLRDRQAVPGVALSTFDGTTTTLSTPVLRQSDWLPGNVACIYDVPTEQRAALVDVVAQKEHVARRAFVHPATVTIEPTGGRAAVRPLRLHPLTVTHEGDATKVADAGPAQQELSGMRHFWRARLGRGEWAVEDLYEGLVERFVGDVVVSDPAAFARVQGRSCLYLANHQVGIESLLFSMLISALSKTVTVTIAKAQHRASWLGTLIAHNFSYPGIVDPEVIAYFDRDDQESLLGLLGQLSHDMKQHGKSLMVHAEGTRSLQCRQPVVKLSSSFIDLALTLGAPIVPVRFVGGLPVEPLETRLEFPLGYGRQDYWLGPPLMPETLAALPLKERKEAVLTALNALGPERLAETPGQPDPDFARAVEAWRSRTGASHEDAVLFATLASHPRPGAEATTLLEGARRGRLELTAEPRSQWLGTLARRLYGPTGPVVISPRD